MSDGSEQSRRSESRKQSAPHTVLYTGRPLVSVIALRVQYSGSALDRLEPTEVQTGYELLWNAFLHFAKARNALVLPPHGEEFVALFGIPEELPDHAFRALHTSMQLAAWLGEWRTRFVETGNEIPHFSLGLHSGETVAVRIPGAEDMEPPWAVAGETLRQATLVAALGKSGQVLVTEAFLHELSRAFPAGWESRQERIEEPAAAGELSWELADFEPLPEHLERAAFSYNDRSGESEVEVCRFVYLYAVKTKRSLISFPVLSASFPGVISDSATAELRVEESESNLPIRRLGKYRVLAAIGAGGMGSVWLASDALGNRFALKTLRGAEGMLTDSDRERLMREANIMSRLQHRNICKLYEAGEYEGIFYLVMEYIEGGHSCGFAAHG